MAKSQIRQYVFTPGAAGVGTIQVPGKVDLQQLLVITNTTKNVILYNFADVTYAGTTVTMTRANDITNWLTTLDNTDGITTITLAVSTVGQSATDTLQVFFEKPELTTRPWDMGTDAFERTRTANPQSMLDADFEYGIQPTKWLTISQERGYPSIFEVPGTDITVTAVITDASRGSGGTDTSSALITVTTLNAHNLTAGTPITITGLDSSITGYDRGQGSFIVYQVPSAVTFTYYATGKVGFSNGDSLYTPACQLRQGGFYTSSNINAVIVTTATSTNASGNLVTVNNTVGMTVGSSVVFNTLRTNAVSTNAVAQTITLGTTVGMSVNMSLTFSGTSFAGITSGATYYVVSIIDSVTITMSVNPSLTPVFVPTQTTTGGNMNVTGGASFGNLVAGTQYYVASVPSSTTLTVSQNIIFTTTISATSAVTNGVALGTTANITVGEIINITGTTIGNLTAGTYYVFAILDGANITVSTTLPTTAGGSGNVFTQTTAYGSMSVTCGTTLILSGSGLANAGFLTCISTGYPTFTVSIPAVACSFTAALSGNTLTVSAIASGALAVGQGIQTTGYTVPTNTIIVSQSSGTTGQAGVYIVSTSTGSVTSTASFQSTSSSTTITVNTYSNHGFVPGSTVNVVVTSDNGFNNHQIVGGPYYVENVISPTQFSYTGKTINFIQPGTTIVATLYARVDSFYQHRPFDGGVQLGTGSPGHGLQAIRMSKKYIRYQSGKAINFNTGFLMAPNFFVRSITATGTAIGSTITIVTDDVDHGCQLGARVKLDGVLTTGFNGTYTVTGIVDERVVQVTAFQTLGSISPTTGAAIQDPCLLSFVGWSGATVRTGTYDEQNGVFFEYDGQQCYVVKRSSTFQLAGTISVTTGSGQVIGINTRFLTQLAAGDRVVIRGMTYVVTQVVSSTLMYVNPQWRGITSLSGIKMTKTIDYKVPQTQWNKDRFDGSNSPFNPSGYLMLPYKMQMVGMQWTWYGAGSIDWMMRGDDGNYKFVHRLRNNNLNNEGWMRTGNMPVRYEVQNEGARSYTVGSVNMGIADTVMTVFDSSFFPTPATGSSITVYIDNEIITYTKTTNAYMTATVLSSSGTTYNRVILSNTTNMAVGQPIVFTNTQGINLGNIISGSTYYILSIATFTGTISGVSYTNAPSVTVSTTSGGTVVTQVNAVATTPYNGLMTTCALIGCTRAQSTTQWTNGSYRTFGAGSAAVHISGTGVMQITPTASPVVSHWGAAFVQDGGFDTDRSYIFSYQSPNITVTTKKTCAFAVRQAPSVSNALTGDLGIRELINRASFLLQGLEITAGAGGTNAALIIEGIINPSNYPTDLTKIPFYSLNSTQLPTGQPSFSQIAPGAGITFSNSATNITTVTNTGINAVGGTSFTVNNVNGIRVGDDVLVPATPAAFFSLTQVKSINGSTITLNQGVAAAVNSGATIYFSRNTAATPGETVFSFVGSPANKDSLDLSNLKELTNTPIGGRGCYPNGPDVLFINVYITQGTVIANMVLRWGEAQA